MKKIENLLTEVRLIISNIENDIDKNHFLLSNVSYESGILGLSLFYSYYALYTNDATFITKSLDYFKQAIDSIDLKNFNRVYQTDSIDNHLSNLGRFLVFNQESNFLKLDSEGYLNQLDSILPMLMKSKINAGDFDYNSGAIASGHYFISRLSTNPEVAVHLADLVKGLKDNAQLSEEGYYSWLSPRLYSNTYLGLSHGSAMIISFLATLISLDIEAELSLDIIDKASSFVLSHYRDLLYSHFPTTNRDENLSDKPFCICYGDIGVAFALLKANVFMAREDVTSVVVQIMQESLDRKRMDFFPRDASITYGAAGLSAFFMELYCITKDVEYRTAAKYWENQVLGYAVHDNKFSGFQSMTSSGHDLWNLSFSWGIVGIGISLMISLDSSLPSLTPLLMIA